MVLIFHLLWTTHQVPYFHIQNTDKISSGGELFTFSYVGQPKYHCLVFVLLARSSEVGVPPEGGGGSLVCGVGVWPAPCVGGPGSVRRELLAYGMAHDTDAGECQRRGVNGVCLGLARTLVVGPPWRMVWSLRSGIIRHQIRGQNGVRIIPWAVGSVWSGGWMAAPSNPDTTDPRSETDPAKKGVRLPLPPTKSTCLPTIYP